MRASTTHGARIRPFSQSLNRPPGVERLQVDDLEADDGLGAREVALDAFAGALHDGGQQTVVSKAIDGHVDTRDEADDRSEPPHGADYRIGGPWSCRCPWRTCSDRDAGRVLARLENGLSARFATACRAIDKNQGAAHQLAKSPLPTPKSQLPKWTRWKVGDWIIPRATRQSDGCEAHAAQEPRKPMRRCRR